MKFKHIVILIIFTIVFLTGILLILKSDTWNLGSIESMHLAGSIISIFSGTGFLIEYKNK